MLSEVRASLENDLSELESRIAVLRETVPLIEELSRQLKISIAYEPSMDLLFLEFATPIDFEKIVSDIYFHNIIDY